jgi:hypothetical protein
MIWGLNLTGTPRATSACRGRPLPLLYFTLIYFTLLYFTLFYFTLLYFILLYFYTYLFCLLVNIFSDPECTYSKLVTGTGGKLKPVWNILCAVLHLPS